MQTIGIVGGGITGITAALELAKTGLFRITIIEKEDKLGGLSNCYEWDDLVWDRFYHVILSRDIELLNLISELDIESKLFWRETKCGFYGEGRLVSLSSSWDFIKFPFMSLWQKIRFVLGILYCARIKDPNKLDRIYVRQWLTKVFGRRVYEKIWDPLLRSKLGDVSDKTSASLIWASITRSYGARNSGSKVEKMGHVQGGYKTIITAAEKKLNEYGVKIIANQTVKQIISTNSKLKIRTNNQELEFNKVLYTIPCPSVLENIGQYDGHPYWQQLKRVDYLSVVCVFLVLKKKLSPFYVINLLDRELPFTGIIEATNVVSPDELNNSHLIYLPKYMPVNHQMSDTSDSDVIELFIEGLKNVFTDLTDEHIIHKKVFRETYVQPLQELNFLERNSGFATPVKNMYLVNSSMIYNSTLNNNAAIALAKKASKQIMQDIASY